MILTLPRQGAIKWVPKSLWVSSRLLNNLLTTVNLKTFSSVSIQTQNISVEGLK